MCRYNCSFLPFLFSLHNRSKHDHNFYLIYIIYQMSNCKSLPSGICRYCGGCLYWWGMLHCCDCSVAEPDNFLPTFCSGPMTIVCLSKLMLHTSEDKISVRANGYSRGKTSGVLTNPLVMDIHETIQYLEMSHRLICCDSKFH